MVCCNGNGNQDVTVGSRTKPQSTTSDDLQFLIIGANISIVIINRSNIQDMLRVFCEVRCFHISMSEMFDRRCGTLGDNICITIRLVISTQIARLARE